MGRSGRGRHQTLRHHGRGGRVGGLHRGAGRPRLGLGGGEQCGHHEGCRIAQDDARGFPLGGAGQSRGDLPHDPRGSAAHARTRRWWADRQHLEHVRPARQLRSGQLRRVEGGHHRPHPGCRPGGSPLRDHRERGPTRLRQHSDDRPAQPRGDRSAPSRPSRSGEPGSRPMSPTQCAGCVAPGPPT